jgi:hypothetical protein
MTNTQKKVIGTLTLPEERTITDISTTSDNEKRPEIVCTLHENFNN